MVLQTPQPSQVFQHHPSDMHHAGVIPLNQPHTPPDPYRPPFANNLHPLPFMNGAYPPPLPQHEHLQQPPLPYLPFDSDVNPHLPPMHPPPQPFRTAQNPAEPAPHQVIDLTGGSPSPEPQGWNLPPDLPPKTPVCIGQLAVTALVLYPVNYLNPGGEQPLGSEKEWAPVRLNYEHNPSKASGPDTIHIKTPSSRGPLGEPLGGETFGVVEQKIAGTVGPMLGKGLIRLEAKVRKGYPNLPILPLMLLVYTPKGNIAVVSHYFQQHGLFLDHPTLPSDQIRLQNTHYLNPHNPPPGGFKNAILPSGRVGHPTQVPAGQWSSPGVAGKSVEVQRSQMDDLFKGLRSGDELTETEPTEEVGTSLYGYQKKALTFLLEREREVPGPDGKFSSLWQRKASSLTGQESWLHLVTQREAETEPREAKGAILADDMGLGKTITCVSLIAATLRSAQEFGSREPEKPPPLPKAPEDSYLSASHFSGVVWGMPEVRGEHASSSKGKGKAAKEQDKLTAEYTRACRIKTNSRATLIVCPLSTVSNWEDQFREHWNGEVTVVGGCGSTSKDTITRNGNPKCAPLRVYVYHGNSRKPDPLFLADFDAVITTYATLASEYSKQTRSTDSGKSEQDEDVPYGSEDECVETDEYGNSVPKQKVTKCGVKRKKVSASPVNGELTSPLQSVNWFRVVLDEAHCIKETNTVGSKASCDLFADRRLCLTGTPVQNKLDDLFALIKFLRLSPLDDKSTWMEFIGSPVKYGQALGIARLQTVMKCITLRRTKDTRAQDGKRILALPPRKDELRELKFNKEEQEIYDQFFNESKAEFKELSHRNEVMKNYVGILQKILRLRQICDHFELVKQPKETSGVDGSTQSYEEIAAAIAKEGINASRASAIFALLKETGTTQCVECGGEMGGLPEGASGESAMDVDPSCLPSAPKRGKKSKATTSRANTRPSSPTLPRIVLTRCQHLFCLECFRQSVFPGWPAVAPDVFRSCSVCQCSLGMLDAVETSAEATLGETSRRKTTKKEKRVKGVNPENVVYSTKVNALMTDLMRTSKLNPYSVNFDSASVEVQLIDGEGNNLEESMVKTVVFSQWTSMLDKIEDALEVNGIKYDRLDGTMKRDERIRAMDALKHDPACEVLLVSLKAGGVGLNLTAAQRVYLVDPYWNPAVENQAVDRIHRLGQTRPVTTIKLIIENTIEARLLEVQRKKTELANMTLGTTSKAELMQRRMEELSQLFGS